METRCTRSCDVHHIAGFLKAVDVLVRQKDLSIALPADQDTWHLSLPSMYPTSASHTLQETDPIGRVALRLYRLEHLERQANDLSLYTNSAYYVVGHAYSHAMDVSRLFNPLGGQRVNHVYRLSLYAVDDPCVVVTVWRRGEFPFLTQREEKHDRACSHGD